MENGARRKRRTWVELSSALLDELHRLAEENETSVPVLCYHWLTMAAWLAAHGQGHLLPPGRRARRGSLGETRPIQFPQSKTEYQRVKRAIEAAGSSVAAVLRTAGEAYVRSGGDIVTMGWPSAQAYFQVA